MPVEYKYMYERSNEEEKGEVKKSERRGNTKRKRSEEKNARKIDVEG
jgi:hypothetical protein